MTPQQLDFIRILLEAVGGDQPFDPYQQPGMGMGYGPAFGAGAASRAAGLDPSAGLQGYRGPASGLPPAVPGPRTEPPVYGGMGYGAAQGAQLPNLLAMLLASNMGRGGR